MVFPSKFMLCLSMLMVVSQTAKVSTSGKGQARRLSETGRVVIYSRFDENLGDSSTSRKVFHDINQVLDSDEVVFESVLCTSDQQRSLIGLNCGNKALQRYDAFQQLSQTFYAEEVFKWCVLKSGDETTAYLEASSSLLFRLPDMIAEMKSAVVVADERQFPFMVTTSFVLVQPDQKKVAGRMLQLLTDSSIDTLLKRPFALQKALHSEIKGDPDSWHQFRQKCSSRNIQPLQAAVARIQFSCAATLALCCSISDGVRTVILTPFPMIPVQVLPEDVENIQDDVFISKVHSEPSDDDYESDPNFYDTLPPECISDECTKCLRNKQGASCQSCGTVCECLCRQLCKKDDRKKRVSKVLAVSQPKIQRNPERLIPRIVHQTWFEDLHDTKRYPNMSRLVGSFKTSGWDYRFYSDAEANRFLENHFPPEVKEAYDALLPGVYADVDIHLESNLDFSIPADVGFMVPIDEMCLWNGFIAASPGHPVLAKAIETVVNQVRNRFTSIDVDATFCPNPELSVLHAYDTLFTAGPCLLGATLNRVLGRKAQTSFVPGEMAVPTDPYQIPGKIVILKQNKWDMGAHRFTLVEENLVVSATDLPDSNDRENLEGKSSHYSTAHAKTGVYGLERLYVDRDPAMEDVRIIVKTY